MGVSDMRRLVIVESPTKANKIASYLGKEYVVDSSRGHVRDLPQAAADIPAKYKGEKWARTGVDVDHDFKPLYVVSVDKKGTIRKLKSLLADCDELYLATDEDREGEAIAWHLLQELKPKVPCYRMVFHEITPEAIKHAVQHPRQIDNYLVEAQETRRILDRLYGYEVSPVLWKKVKPKLSAGRVQSVATRLVVDRERERMAFVSADYCTITATVDAGAQADPRYFPARLASVGDLKIAQGKDFNEKAVLVAKKTIRLTPESAAILKDGLAEAKVSVSSVDAKPYTRRPYPPFRTTTLQQEAGRKLGFTTQRTMMVAQELYEGGFITYMRTDSINLSEQAITAARSQVADLYGSEYLPAKPRTYSSKVKNAQEAHEAIRPAGAQFVPPAKTGLLGDQLKIYDLIWKRTLASQMADAKGQSVSVKFDCDFATPVQITEPGQKKPVSVSSAQLVSSGRTITFPGFLKAYVESIDEGASDDHQTPLPSLTVGDALAVSEIAAEDHQTKPPARYTEPSLVARLEELEIGRPSTYASIIRTITSRDYVYKRGQALVPTWLAFAVTRLLEKHFGNLVDYTFTASLEDALDEIANGNQDHLAVLRSFYFGGGEMAAGPEAEGLRQIVADLGDIDARGISSLPVGGADSGIMVRVGRYGAYLEDEQENRANIPEDLAPDELDEATAKQLLENNSYDGRQLGVDPSTGNEILVKNGRFGPYVTETLPEGSSGKPRTASLFKSMSIETIDLDTALQLFSLPRTVGLSDGGEPITAQNGRFGPYLKCGSDSRSLTDEDQLFTITLEQAKELFAQPKGGARKAAAPAIELGTDPVSGKAIVVKSGRFGPYVTDGEYNATLRKGDAADQVTLEKALELLAERKAKGPAGRAGRGGARKSASSRSAKTTTGSKTKTSRSAAKTTKKS